MPQLIHGNSKEKLKLFPDSHFDACVTDPPYELGFMGKKWDSSGIAYDPELWSEVMRVLKPGGHLLAFGGTRTFHRMACAIEDAGFEIRDMIQWIYGSGFPKSTDISKQLDKMAGAEREIIGKNPNWRAAQEDYHWGGGGTKTAQIINKNITAPATEKAKQWDGWGTALKPANEPICVARKPLSEKTIAENVLRWGTGAINIDGCRIATEDNLNGGGYSKNYTTSDFLKYGGKLEYVQPEGRFPANILFDEEAGALLDQQSGTTKSSNAVRKNNQSKTSGKGIYGKFNDHDTQGYQDQGGASRFFYCSKASGKEKNIDGQRCSHPTVKPIDLMRYLCRLVTPPGGHVLDPFGGSGTTGCACAAEGFDFTLIELSEEYLPLISARCNSALTSIGLSLITDTQELSTHNIEYTEYFLEDY